MENIDDVINDNIYDNKPGLPSKIISELLNIPMGSVDTTYQRSVRKYIVEPYRIYRIKNEIK